jgi:glycosyltransferase involved in cell wall biosynthesis
MRSRLGAADGTVVVAHVGRLAQEKGLDVALVGMRIAAEMLPGRFVFAFAGDGPYWSQCLRAAPAQSVFLGRIGGADLSSLYASADMFVFPSVTDTFGNVLLEAMASGLPVVAADARPTRELVTPESGVLFPAGNARALASRIVGLALDREHRLRMGRAGRAAAEGRSWGGVFDALIEDYLGVCGGKGSGEEHEMVCDRGLHFCA